MSINSKHLFWQWRGVILAAPAATLLVAGLRLTGLLQLLEWQAYDQYMRWRPQPEDERIAIVGLDEGDVREQGQAIMPDAVYAEVIEKLSAQEPRAIGLDIFRDVPVEPGHERLQTVFRNTPNLVGVRKILGDTDRDTIDAPPVLAELGQVGINDGVIDADNTIRRGLLMVTDPEGMQRPSLALYLALLYLDREGIGPDPVAGTDFWELNGSVFRPFEASDGGYVRADAGGYQTLINYRGGSGRFETVSLGDVLNDRIPPDWAKDRIILIGAVGESFKDRFYVPYSGGLLEIPESMAGVEIHANLTSQIISAALDGRPLMRTWPEWVELLWIGAWAAAGALIVWQQRHPGRRPLVLQILSLTAAGAALVTITLGAFAAGWWLPSVPALLALAGGATGVTTYLAQSASQIRQTFGRYLSAQIVANLLENPEKLKLGGENRLITILTSDLRGFTALSEQLAPEQVVELLNLYLGYMSEVVNQYGGTIDEFMGDGILVVFGAPIRQQNAPARACAIAMQAIMPQVNATLRANGYPEQEMGIGINTGCAIVGNIGSERRTKYSVIGSAVNLAFRIESYTTGGQILISEDTHDRIDENGRHQLAIRSRTEVYPKGIRRPITIYDVAGIGGATYNLSLAEERHPLQPLTVPMAVSYAPLIDKQVSQAEFDGSLVQLSPKAALLSTQGDQPLELLTNIRLRLVSPGIPSDIAEADIYGKVQQIQPDDTYLIVFTARTPATASWMNQPLEQPPHRITESLGSV